MISRLRSIIQWIIPSVFIALVFLSLFGGILGIDPDMKWGPIRKGLLFVGAAGILVTGLLQALAIFDTHLMRRHRKLDLHLETSEGVVRSVEPVPSGRLPKIPITLVALILGVVYVGLVSVWHWTNWPATTDYYGMLGDAFVHGKTYLPIEPPAELAKLSDPYSSEARKGLDVIGDLSYYQGKYYLYWGPTPAIALAGLELLGFPLFGDQMVVFGAVCLTFIFGTLTVIRLWRLYFSDVPGWLLVAGIVVMGTVHPMLWTLNSPSIYTASNASGQAFLIGGVFFATVAATDISTKNLNLALAGVFWGLAIASRLTTGAAVAVLLLGAFLFIGLKSWPDRKWRQAAAQLLALALPLAIVMLLYGYYNFVRFGNFLEPGFRFQLTEANKSVQFVHDQLFSLRFLIPNSLYHFFAPLQLRSKFPFLRPVYGEYLPFSEFIKRLGIVPGPGVGAIAGLVFAAPALAMIQPLLRRFVTAGRVGPTRETAADSSAPQGLIVHPSHIGMTFFAAGVASSLPVLTYTYTASRYDLDFVPLLALSAVIGMWYLYKDSRPYPVRSRLAVILIVALVATSTTISFVLALSGAGSRFDDLNPSLYKFLVAFFSR